MNDKCISYENIGLGNVIRILDQFTLIVNVGLPHLHKGNSIVVFVPVEPIFDLDGSVLATYEFIKDTLEVIETSSEYSICQKKVWETTEPGLLDSFPLSPLFDGKKERVPLNVNEEDISPFKKVDPTIKIGDPIRLFE